MTKWTRWWQQVQQWSNNDSILKSTRMPATTNNQTAAVQAVERPLLMEGGCQFGGGSSRIRSNSAKTTESIRHRTILFSHFTTQCVVKYAVLLLWLFDCCLLFRISCKFAVATACSAWGTMLLLLMSPTCCAVTVSTVAGWLLLCILAS